MRRVNFYRVWQQYGEYLLHLVFIWWYFASLNVHWQANWLNYDLHGKTVHPFSALTFLFLFYLNAFVLIPFLLKQKRWVAYGLVVLGAIVLLEGGRALILSLGQESPDISFWSVFFGENHLGDAMSLGLIVSTGYVFTKDWIINLRLIEKLEAEKTAAELAHLKAQVDPHFLFNTLNSLYALALEENSPDTADGIAKLGTLMRYNLHDSQAEKIPLGKEIDYVQKYIELQQLRTTEQNRVDLDIQVGEAGQNALIAPMLLIPFVENAFKYGISPTEKTFIRISMALKKGFFHLNVENSIIAKAQSQKTGGLGLQNAKKRLSLLYPGQHELLCQKEGSTFTVHLKIVINP